MHWLSNSKVRLGLIVNILYFLSLYAPPSQHTRARTYERPAERLRSKSAPDFAPLPQQMLMTPLKAETHYWKTSDQLDVYLTRDLLLIRRRGHTLLLSPTYATKVLNPEQPRSVLLNFTSFSHEQVYDKDSSFVITADGAEVWRYGTRAPTTRLPGTPRHSTQPRLTATTRWSKPSATRFPSMSSPGLYARGRLSSNSARTRLR